MHPAYIPLALLAVVVWSYWIYLVNDEIEKLQSLAQARLTPYEAKLKIPDWKLLRHMSQQRVWVVLALALAPALVITWGLSLIIGLFFILLPEMIREVIEDTWLTIKRSSSRS